MDKFNTIFYEDKNSSVGIYPQKDRTFLALTFSGYKNLKLIKRLKRKF